MAWYNYFIEHNRYLNLLGIIVIIGIATLLSKKRSAISYRLVATALVFQGLLACFVLKTATGYWLVTQVARAIELLYECAHSGISFVFGPLARVGDPTHFIFAVHVLPVIIFFGAFMALLFHYGIVQRLVQAISFVIRPLLGTSGAETLCAISNSFLGQTEAPLLVRHYLADMTKSELLVVMVSGMATISGAILVVFSSMGVPAPHLLAASVMAIPSSLLMAKILYPETEESTTAHGAQVTVQPHFANIFDAIASGTSDGMYLALNVGAMLIAFLALLSCCNSALAWISNGIGSVGSLFGYSWSLPVMSMNLIFSYIGMPFAYLLGFTGDTACIVGQLLGTKVAVNEVIAYADLVRLQLPERATAIMTYALCGFSNFSCIGIQIGGIGALVPEKRAWLTELGLYAVLGGAFSNLLSAMMASLLL